MPVEQTHCLQLSCDGCGIAFETEYAPHYPSLDAAQEEMQESDWIIWEGDDRVRVWCYCCLPTCVECGHMLDYHGTQGADACEIEVEDDDNDEIALCPCHRFVAA